MNHQNSFVMEEIISLDSAMAKLFCYGRTDEGAN